MQYLLVFGKKEDLSFMVVPLPGNLYMSWNESAYEMSSLKCYLVGANQEFLAT